MLTHLPYQKVLADIPHYRATSNHDGCVISTFSVFRFLGFWVDQVNRHAVAETVEISRKRENDRKDSRHSFLASPWQTTDAIPSRN